MGKLDGKIAVITGGNSGIGLATAEAFIREGAKLLIIGRREDAVAAAVQQLGPSASGFTGDVALPETHEQIAVLLRERFGKVDIYVANAGTNVIAPTQTVSLASYDSQFETNTKAVFWGIKTALPVLRDNASIVLISSIATAKVLEGHAVYAGAKAALEAFATAWALELSDRRIRVNVVSPGPTSTPILGKLGIAQEHLPEFEAQLAQTIPLGRIGQPAEIARAVLFLASDEASFITGANLPVDGGISIT